MQSVISPKAMQDYDRLTLKTKSITSFELMTRAAKKLKDQWMLDFGDTKKHILIVAGLGNNGGDGMMLGHFLKETSFDITLCVVGDVGSNQGESAQALSYYTSYESITDKKDVSKLKTLISDAEIIVDAIFGLGLSRDVEGIYHDVITLLNAADKEIISLDFPSGIDPYSGRTRGVAIKATQTYIIQTYKYGNLLEDALDYHGKQTIVDIGVEIPKSNSYLIDHNSMESIGMKRSHNSHKYTYGSVLIVGGSKTMMGAPNLSALAALRSGAGLVTIAYDEDTFNYRVMPNMEIMHTYYKSNNIQPLLKKINSVAFGMGLGKDNFAHQDTLKILLENKIPLVIDADGLQYYRLLKDDVTVTKPVILTPHFGELMQLLDIDKDTFYSGWVDHLNTFVKRYNVTILLKGPVSIIVTKDTMAFSVYGNPGMATAGSGDVLTGILASRIGQRGDVNKAVEDGLVLHGLSGDKAAKNANQMSIIASDIIDALRHFDSNNKIN